MVRNIYGYHQVCGRDGNECGLVWEKRAGRNRYQLISLETWSAEAIWVKKADTFWVWQSCSCWLTLTFLLLATFMPDAEHLLGSVALQKKKRTVLYLAKFKGRYGGRSSQAGKRPAPRWRAAACRALPRCPRAERRSASPRARRPTPAIALGPARPPAPPALHPPCSACRCLLHCSTSSPPAASQFHGGARALFVTALFLTLYFFFIFIF